MKLMPGITHASTWQTMCTWLAVNSMDYTKPMTTDMKVLETVCALDYMVVKRENETLAAILAYLWVTAKAASETQSIDLTKCMLGRTVETFAR